MVLQNPRGGSRSNWCFWILSCFESTRWYVYISWVFYQLRFSWRYGTRRVLHPQSTVQSLDENRSRILIRSLIGQPEWQTILASWTMFGSRETPTTSWGSSPSELVSSLFVLELSLPPESSSSGSSLWDWWWIAPVGSNILLRERFLVTFELSYRSTYIFSSTQPPSVSQNCQSPWPSLNSESSVVSRICIKECSLSSEWTLPTWLLVSRLTSPIMPNRHTKFGKSHSW